MFKNIRSAIATKCFGKTASFELIDDSEYLAIWNFVPRLSNYFASVLDDLAKQVDLNDLWAEYQPKLHEQMEKLKACSNGENKANVDT